MLTSVCAETIEPVLDEGQNLTAVEGNASVYQVYPVCRIAGDGVWGPGAGGRGGCVYFSIS